MDTTDLLKKVRKVEIKTKGLSKHIFSGEYHSAFKGRGMSFSEVRDYQYGDDVRNIDWNVTAKTGDAHIKVFEEERELTVMLIVDVSRSGYFGTAVQLKSEMILELAAVIAFSATTNNDKVGAILFADGVVKYIPPKKGRHNILRIIRELIFHNNSGSGTDLNQALEYFNNVQKKRSIAFILSDFLTQDYSNALSIAARRHDVIGLQVYDEREGSLPNVGLLRVVDAERGTERVVDTSVAAVREQYAAAYEARQSALREVFHRNRSDILHINTKDDYVKSLLQFFKRRKR